MGFGPGWLPGWRLIGEGDDERIAGFRGSQLAKNWMTGLLIVIEGLIEPNGEANVLLRVLDQLAVKPRQELVLDGRVIQVEGSTELLRHRHRK